MALVNCPECGHEMSEYAKICPNCGCPNRLEQMRKDKIEAEYERQASVIGTIDYYDNQLRTGIGVLVISLILGYASYKWMNSNPMSVFGIFLIVTWCQIIMEKLPTIGIIGSIVVIILAVGGLAALNLPEFIQEIIVMLMLAYPLYFTIFRPLINVVRIERERRKLKE